MEDTLRELLWQVLQKLESVLILVLMEDTLRVKKLTIYQISQSLNPCFNGRYSQSPKFFENEDDVDVLILVLMEDTLRGPKLIIKTKS